MDAVPSRAATDGTFVRRSTLPSRLELVGCLIPRSVSAWHEHSGSSAGLTNTVVHLAESKLVRCVQPSVQTESFAASQPEPPPSVRSSSSTLLITPAATLPVLPTIKHLLPSLADGLPDRVLGRQPCQPDAAPHRPRAGRTDVDVFPRTSRVRLLPTTSWSAGRLAVPERVRRWGRPVRRVRTGRTRLWVSRRRRTLGLFSTNTVSRSYLFSHWLSVRPELICSLAVAFDL